MATLRARCVLNLTVGHVARGPPAQTEKLRSNFTATLPYVFGAGPKPTCVYVYGYSLVIFDAYESTLLSLSRSEDDVDQLILNMQWVDMAYR